MSFFVKFNENIKLNSQPRLLWAMKYLIKTPSKTSSLQLLGAFSFAASIEETKLDSKTKEKISAMPEINLIPRKPTL